MNVTLSPRTQKLLQDRMSQGDYASPDEVIQIALESMEAASYEDLDEETRSAIERADAQGDRGEGISVDEAFARLRQKHLGAH